MRARLHIFAHTMFFFSHSILVWGRMVAHIYSTMYSTCACACMPTYWLLVSVLACVSRAWVVTHSDFERGPWQGALWAWQVSAGLESSSAQLGSAGGCRPVSMSLWRCVHESSLLGGLQQENRIMSSCFIAGSHVSSTIGSERLCWSEAQRFVPVDFVQCLSFSHDEWQQGHCYSSCGPARSASEKRQLCVKS